MREREVRYVVGLGIASVMNVALLLAEAAVSREFTHPYLVWNLALAWVPLALSYWLVRVLERRLWSSWEALVLSLAWGMFLPNSFYIISDFIHLPDLLPGRLLFGIVVTTAFALTGLQIGVTSLSLVQRELACRYGSRLATGCAAIALLMSSFAIYIGRDLRWNSWDVLTNPFGLLFDISERLLHPAEYAEVLAVVLPFFALLATLYFTAQYVAHIPTRENH